MDQVNMKEESTEQIEAEENLYVLPHPKLSLIGILISTFFLRVAFGSTTVLMPIFIWKHLGMEGWAKDVSVIVVEITYAIAVIISSGYFGFKSDTSDAKKWILLGTAAGGLILGGYGICALNWSGWIGIIPLTNGLLIFGMSLYHFLHGLAGSCKVNASYGYISRFSVYENRATRIGFYNVAVTGGRSVGVILAGLLYDLIVGVSEKAKWTRGRNRIAFGLDEITQNSFAGYWDPIAPTRLAYLYLLFGFAIIISAVVVYLMIDKTKSVVKEEKYSLRKELATSWRLMTNKNRRGIILPLIGTASVLGILNNWGFLILSLESTPGTASYATVGITLAMGVPMALWGWVADKIGRKRTLAIGVSGLILLTIAIGIAFFTNMLTGGQPWNDPTSQFDPAGLYSNVWILILLGIAVLMASAYFPAISGRLGDSSSIDVEDDEEITDEELEKQAEFHGSTMSIQQTIMSVSEIIGIILGGLALLVVFAITKGDDTNFAYNIVGILVPIIVLLILTAIATFLWPAEDEFVKTAKVRRRKRAEKS
jgi:MFS family permease